jgi:TPR repeat protein
LQRTCDSTASEGCLALGRLYASGTGVQHNDSTAAELFRRSCNGNDPAGCLAFAIALETGKGIGQNFQRAARNYSTACDRNIGEACYRLSTLMDRGIWGGPHAADEMRRRGCELGHRPACLPRRTPVS